MNLYRVQLKGFIASEHRVSYVLAKDATSAENKVVKDLKKRSLGFSSDRALDSIELIAEGKEYPDCKCRVYL